MSLMLDGQILARRGYSPDVLQSIDFGFIIDGKPVGKERPRLGKFGGSFTPKKTKDYEFIIGFTCKPFMQGKKPFTGKVSVDVAHFCVGEKYPDLDNVIKTVLDGMNGIVYKDDKQVNKITSSRIQASKDYLMVHVKGVLV